MRRLRAAVTPLMFYAGLALLAAGIALIARWPMAHWQVDGLDLRTEETTSAPWSVWSMLQDWTSESTYSPADAAAGVLGVAGVLAMLGLVLVARSRRLIGGVLIGAAAVSAWVFVALCGLDLRLTRAIGNCLEAGYLWSGVAVLEAAGVFVAWMTALAAIGWIVIHPRFRPRDAVALGIAVSMAAVALHGGWAALGYWDDNLFPHSPSPPAPALWPIAALLAAGIIASLRWPLYASRLVSLLLLVFGALTAAVGVAVAHDAELRGHEQRLYAPRNETVQTRTCETPPLGPVIYVEATEVLLSGALMGRIDEEGYASLLEEKLLDERQKFMDLHEAANDSGTFRGDLNLMVRAGTSLDAMRKILVASERAGFRQVHVASIRRTSGGTWTRATIHEHACAVSIELSDEGTPIDSFTSWADLVHAADGRATPLQVSAD